jgi:hypothetical protein
VGVGEQCGCGTMHGTMGREAGGNRFSEWWNSEEKDRCSDSEAGAVTVRQGEIEAKRQEYSEAAG